MAATNSDELRQEKRLKIFRWYFYIALLQFLLYFIVPAVIFPASVIKDIEVISALTLGLPVGLFFLLVNVLGFFKDRSRRTLYGSIASVLFLYFIWAGISLAFIERMDYLLR